MGQAIEGSNRRLDQPVARLVVEIGNQAKTTAIAFVGGFIESRVGCAHHRASHALVLFAKIARARSPAAIFARGPRRAPLSAI